MPESEQQLTDDEAFAVIEGLADAAQVAHVVGDEQSVEDALKEIESIAADHFDGDEDNTNFEDYQ